MTNICLANNKIFSTQPGQSILDGARNANIVLEHSCRTGKCGICKAKVLEGTTNNLQAEESLSENEAQQGFILTCARTAVTDLKLDISDLGKLAAIKKRTLACKIDQLHYLADDVIQVILRFPPNSLLSYLPGQYIDVIYKDIRRSYSIANTQSIDGKIELHIRKVEQGQLSNYWFNSAKENDLLRIEGPHGSFYFREESKQKILLLATGTGIAPVKAFLESFNMNTTQISEKTVDLYWGGRNESDIYWSPEFTNFEMGFYPVLSQASSQWNGLTGYIQNAALQHNPDLSNTTVYACGSPRMISSAKQLLVANGLNLNQFFSDAFVSS